jgi:LAO/AO transport system kinase
MASVTSVGALVEGLRKGDRRAVARLISLVEDGAAEASEAIREVYPLTGHASTIGLTGAPGAGKSTLINGLVVLARAEEKSVGVIACDPTSPFSGGALLGDRVRMQEHALDEKVFIRSMATRGHLGGLSLAAPEAMRVLEAAGSDVVIVETVGVGQSEVEVAKQADTTIVVLAPGMGDAIQAAKAGVLEIADIFCVNKSDKDGAKETVRDVRGMLELGHGRDPEWEVPIVLTSAATDQGIDDLWAAIRAHEAHLRTGDRLAERRRERFGAEIREIVGERLKAALEEAAGADVLSKLTDEVLDRKIDPYTAAGRLLEKFGLPTADH